MSSLERLGQASTEFAKRLAVVTDEQWKIVTPNDEWNVEQLVAHVIGGNMMAVALLQEAPADEALRIIRNTAIEGDPLNSFEASSAAQLEMFERPGAFEMTVHHPVGDVSGEQLVGFRIGDLALHAWDLARAIGTNEELHPGSLHRHDRCIRQWSERHRR